MPTSQPSHEQEQSPPEASADATRGRIHRRRTVVISGIAVLVIAAAAVGYALGASGGEDLEAARVSGQVQGQKAGTAKGTVAGRKAGRRAGAKADYASVRTRASRRAYRRVVAKAERKAAREKSDITNVATPTPPTSGAYTEELPNGRPGYVLPEEQRSLSCVGLDAETGECVGD